MTPFLDASFGGIGSLLDQIHVTIDGQSQTMFAVGIRQSFPQGTCLEDIEGLFPDQPGDCTPPQLGVHLLLWQSHAADAPPDRLIVIAGDVGTSNFAVPPQQEFPPHVEEFPPHLVFWEGQDHAWTPHSGTLISEVTITSQSCALPLPPFAHAATCSVALFDEQGTFDLREWVGNGPAPTPLSLTIPRQTMHGIWHAITETQPIA